MPALEPAISMVELHDEERGVSRKYNIPQGLKKLLEEISREVLRAHPENTYKFIADYLEGKLNKDDYDGYMKPVYKTADGKIVTILPDGSLVDSDGKVLPPGTKLFTNQGIEISNPVYKTADGKIVTILPDGSIVDSDGKVLPPGTKLFTSQGIEISNPVYKTSSGRTIRVTPSGALIDANGKPVPPGKKLYTLSGEEIDERKLYDADGREVRMSPSGHMISADGKSLPPGTKLRTANGTLVDLDSDGRPVYGDKKGTPSKEGTKLYDENGKEMTLTPSGHILNASGQRMPPGTKLRTASNREISILPDGTVPPRKPVVLDTAMQDKLQLYTEDGLPIKYSPSGQLLNAKGEILPRGTKLMTKDGTEFRRNTRGSVYDANGLPVFLTADGRMVTVGEDGRLYDSNGKIVPPGTKLFTPKGEAITVQANGRPVPNSGDVNRYATVIQAAYRGHLARKGRLSKDITVYKTADGKTVTMAPDGSLVDSDGKALPPGTKLLNDQGIEISNPAYKTADGKMVTIAPDGSIVDSDGKVLPPGTKIFNNQGIEIANPVYKTSSGKTIRVTPSGAFMDANGKPIPPGKKLYTPSGEEMSKPVYTTEDGKEIKITPSGTLVFADGQPVPEGTKLVSSTGQPVVERKLFDAEGKEVRTSPTGHMISADGKVLPSGTKLFTGQGVEISNTVYKTADGKKVTIAPDGSLVDSDGKVLPPGTKLFTNQGMEISNPGYKTADGKTVTVLPDGSIVDSDGKVLPPGTKLFTGQGIEIANPVYKTSSGRTFRVTPSGAIIDANGKPVAPSQKLYTSNGEEMSKPIYTTEDGKEIKITPSGTLVFGNGQPVPPGTKLISFTGQPVVVSSAGAPVPTSSIHDHVDKVLSKALDLVDILQSLDDEAAPGDRAQNEWLMDYWSTENIPGRFSNPGDATLASMADALNFVLSEENSMGPIEGFINMIQKAIQALIAKLSGSGSDDNDAMPPESTIVLDTAMQKKLQLYTADGQPIKYTPSGQMINANGEILPPGTKLMTKDGTEFKRNSRGSVYDVNGLPVFLTEDGRLVTVAEDGTLLDSNGKIVPPGTQLFTPKGESITVQPNGKPAPTSGDVDRYATVIQAAFRGHMARKGRLSKDKGSKFNIQSKSPEKLYDSEGKEVRMSPSGRMLSTHGQPLPPGTKLRTADGTVVELDSDGRPILNDKVTSSKEGTMPGKLYDENGREMTVTPSGHILSASGELMPPGTRLRTASNREISILPNGTIIPPRKTLSRLYTSDGRPVKTTDSGHYVLENGESLPPGTKIKISGSRDMIISEHGGLEEDRPTPPTQGRRMSGRMFTEDGLEIEASPSGRVLTLSGSAAPADTKIKTIDLRNIISGDGAFPETNLFTEGGIPVVVTSSGRVFTVEGKELFPGTILKTSDNRIMTVSPSGGIVLRPVSSAPSTTSGEGPSGRKVGETQSGGALTPGGGRAIAPSGSRPTSANASKRKLFTEDGEEIYMDSDGKLLNKDGEEMDPNTFVQTKSGNLVDRTQLPKPPGASTDGGAPGTADDLLAPPAAIIADMVRRNTEPREGWLSEEQADPESIMVEWASTVDEFMTEQISTIEGLLNGNIPMSEARGTIIFLTVSFVVGLVVGYGIARSLGLVGPSRNPHAQVVTSLGNLHEIGDVIGPDGRPLRHGMDPGMGRCDHTH